MVASELIQRMMTSQSDRLERKVIALSVQHLLSYMAGALAKGKRIEIRSFGGFSVRYRTARTIHHPKIYVYVPCPATYLVHFKPGKALRERVNIYGAQTQFSDTGKQTGGRHES